MLIVKNDRDPEIRSPICADALRAFQAYRQLILNLERNVDSAVSETVSRAIDDCRKRLERVSPNGNGRFD
ncbi:hypothetical protein [Caballeronia humi]|uniref:hypothetical protein n=1 Tax=Caballeronia humi TaxID=326474 RepID=UPI000AEC59BC|nr:hypothetical protein [Caballeronia humi]